MKRSSLILLSSVAAITMAGLLACGSKEGSRAINAKNTAKPVGGVEQKALPDQSGSMSLTGPGVSAKSEGNANDPFSVAGFNPNLIVEDTAALSSAEVSDSDKKAIAEAQATGTYINFNCSFPANSKIAEYLKTLKESKPETSKDVTVLSATMILICKNIQVSERTTITAGTLFLRNAYIDARLKTGKMIVRAESIYSQGDSNSFSAPLKADGGTSLDLIVSKSIVGAYKADGSENKEGAGARLKLLVAKAKERAPKGRTKNTGDKAVRPGAVPVADPAVDMDLGANTDKIIQDFKSSNTIEEDNGNTEGI